MLDGLIFAALGLALVVVAPSRVLAQDCDCDHELGTDVTVVDGMELGIAAGDVVCLASGERPFLRLSQFVGSEDAPIVVTNCGGLVTIANTDRAYALVVEGESRYVRVTGSGAAGMEHGIRVSAPDRDPYAGVGVWLQGRSSDVEIDHVEVFDTGFAGVMAKTDPGCDDRAAWPDFVMRNVHLHHLWVHDTGGEGFYVGSTQTMGYERTCDGATVTIPAHFMEGVEIDHVLVEDTGWDGAQIGFARSGCSFHDNVVRRVGLAGEMYQQQGLQIGAYSACEVRRNVLSDGAAMGIIVLDSADSLFADNVIARFAGDGIYANLRGLVPSASYRFVHNTIVSPAGAAIRVFGDGVDGAVAWNNFVIAAPDGISAGSDVGIDIADNVTVSTIADANVREDDDFHLEETSPARGAGRDLTAMGFAIDLDGRTRAMPPSVGAYEHTDDAPPPTPPPPPSDAGSSPPPDGSPPGADAMSPRADASPGADAASGSPADDGGCGCRMVGSRSAGRDTTGSLGLLLAVVSSIALRGRRRSA